MRMDTIQLDNKNQLIHDYRYHFENISTFFDYHPFQSYKQRVQDLQSQTFKREELSSVLHTMNKQWAAPDSTQVNIERLKDDKSVVVVGGQQAGVMTGPLYSINKIISLIHCAREQEKELNIPIIPVFWIAGEDHDFDEINHVFLLNNSAMVKHTMPQHITEKRPVSDIDIDQPAIEEWTKNFFGTFQETNHTKKLYQLVQSCLYKSTTYTDFFARLIFQLFPDDGVVLIDSNDSQLRELESDYFVRIIENQSVIAKSVYENQNVLNELGYTTPLELEQNDAHLFVHVSGERILLKRNSEGDWVGKQNEIKYTTEKMIQIAIHEPHRLSNNVVTRPLMQEMLFPSLAFIGGDGEIRYWTVLKNAFHSLGIKMPPILPRLSITYITKSTESLLKKHNISLFEAVNKGVGSKKEAWFANQSGTEIEQITKHLKKTVTEAHEPLRHFAEQIRSDVGDMARKNLTILHEDIDFIKNRMIQEVKEKYYHELNQFELMDAILYPHNGLQERVWNIFPLINANGFQFMQDILNQSISFEQDHYIAYI